MRAAIVVPYRDRAVHLRQFLDRMRPYRHDVIVIHQGDELPFNRAKLFNVFFKEYGSDYDYFVCHDVDMIPIDADYSYSDIPTHLATKCSQFGFVMPYPEYFGGVTMFTSRDFERVDGYSNDFWGWGGEDDEMRKNVLSHGLSIGSRVCKFDSLPHASNINTDLHAKNIRRLHEGRISGLSNCEYKVVDKVKRWITVRFD